MQHAAHEGHGGAVGRAATRAPGMMCAAAGVLGIMVTGRVWVRAVRPEWSRWAGEASPERGVAAIFPEKEGLWVADEGYENAKPC